MAAVRPDWVAARLAKLVEDVNWSLDALTASHVLGVDPAGRDVVKVAAMPKTAVAHAQALAFVTRRKVGALIGMTKERVVLIRKSTTPDGTIVWSGPVFLKSKSFSLGLTGGYFKMMMCLAIMNEQGLSNVLRPHHNMGLNAAFLIDMNGSRVRRLNTSSSGTMSQVTMDNDGGMMAKYYLMEAGMVDLSCRGGSFGLDNDLNTACYGKGFDAQAVLQCKVQPPPEFQPTYDRLNAYVREVKDIRGPSSHPRPATTMHQEMRSTTNNTGGAAGGQGFSRASSMQHTSMGRVSSVGEPGLPHSPYNRKSSDSTVDWQQQQQQYASSPK